MKTRALLIAVLFLVGALVACSSDDSGDKDAGVTPDKGATDTTKPPADSGPIADTGPATDTGPAADVADTGDAQVGGACINADDGAKLATEEQRDAISDAAKTCGLGCLAETDKQQCATDCVVEETELSEGCAACYVGVIMCSIDNCLLQCAADPSSKECVDCQEDNKCMETFYSCSGMNPAS